MTSQFRYVERTPHRHNERAPLRAALCEDLQRPSERGKEFPLHTICPAKDPSCRIGVGYIEGHDESDVIHIGGTSGGSYLTKDLFQIYARIRFLEHANSPILRRKYAKLYSRFTSSEQVRGLLSQTSEADLAVMDNLMARLAQQATP